jgi:hypothetical protein
MHATTKSTRQSRYDKPQLTAHRLAFQQIPLPRLPASLPPTRLRSCVPPSGPCPFIRPSRIPPTHPLSGRPPSLPLSQLRSSVCPTRLPACVPPASVHPFVPPASLPSTLLSPRSLSLTSRGGGGGGPGAPAARWRWARPHHAAAGAMRRRALRRGRGGRADPSPLRPRRRCDGGRARLLTVSGSRRQPALPRRLGRPPGSRVRVSGGPR